ncbi:MAG TPA: cyclic nucleotide-binding domain-containing protein [Spirochaetota bacterium]|nr:cyclic nucleotide-binding domain-containing protein [Spirochaetota bacterium]HQP49006.1 cyclic nucleotide-binding domain-containing protein [Spirochaetota bacterium]
MKRILKFSNNEIIIKKGTTDRRMFIILNGTVEILMNEGLKQISLSVLGKRDFFGEISLFNNSPRTADVIARGNVKLTFIDSIKELDDFLVLNPSFAREMAKTLAARIAHTNSLLLKELSGKSQSVAKFFW